MDDKTIFNQQQANQTSPSQEQPQRLTTQDLYGPSTPQQTISQDQTQMNQQPANAQAVDTSVQQTAQGYDYQGYQQTGLPATPANPLLGLLQNKIVKIGGIVLGVFLLLIILIGIISRAGHGGGLSGYNATITYWGLWEDSKTMQPIIDDFEKQYPGIKVNYQKQDPQNYKDRLITRIMNNTNAPDVFTFHNTWVPVLTSNTNNILVPLSTNVISPDDFKKEYFPVVQNDMTKNGAIYGLPQGIDTLALYVNKDLFTNAGIDIPMTWENFKSAAKALTVKDQVTGRIKTAGVALGTVDNITHFPDILSLIMVSNGIDFTKIDQQQSIITSYVIPFYLPFAQGTDSVWDDKMSNSRDAFANGNVAMYFGYSWDYFIIKAMGKKDLNFAIYPVPYLPTGDGNKKVTIASYWANGVSQKSSHQKESLLFLKYLAQKDVLQKIYTESSKTRAFGMPYARRDLAATVQNNPLVAPFVQQAEYATSSYFASDTYDTTYNGPLNDYLANVFRQLNQNISPETAVQSLINGIYDVKVKTTQ